MTIVNPDSLAATLDALNDALFFEESLSTDDRRDAAAWIAGRQGLAGAYRGMPAPTEADFGNAFRLYTGETIRSRVGTAHILGEEACRALMLLRPLAADVTAALELSQVWLREPELQGNGRYCCATCSVAMWRHLATRPWPEADSALADGIRILRERRVDGSWRSYPFWYTVLALTETATPAAIEELRYVEPRLGRRAMGGPTSCELARRRLGIAERALALI